MNRLACRVMVAVAGMAVLGMTATLAGAQITIRFSFFSGPGQSQA